ncbi:MerR family transcriptional regulator [Nocardia sp. NPDC058499]|uniref:MerR family transcriptional regulator n=1 Tax=Nocardia sp. NPDC058499 TaxID=3346530 RepID=UPI003647F108
MRISEIAAAAGTTPRAVRHYHRLGLLPEPVRPDNGYRDYGMAELTRLMRIRWLADNGLPLGAVAAVFANEHGASDTEDLRADLAALHDEITQRITQLERKQEGVARMLAAVDAGRRLTALPDEVADAFDRAASRPTNRSAPHSTRNATCWRSTPSPATHPPKCSPGSPMPSPTRPPAPVTAGCCAAGKDCTAAR